MYNKKALRDIVKNLGSAKAPTKKRDIIYDPMGQWTNPGQNTRVPTPNGNITMGANPETGQPIPFPVFAQPNVGPGVMMQPGQDYTFPGAEYVDEFPQVKKGGLVKQPKKYSKSLMAKNILFVKNALLNKKKSVKNKIFDPNSPYFQDGGTFEIELDDAEIDQYKQGGYIVEELDAYAKGGSSSCPKDHVWDSNTKKCVKVYTLANDKKLIDGVSNWAMQSNDPDKISSEYNDQIKHYLYSGKYGYDPVSGTLYPLKKEQKTVADAETKKILAKQDDKAAYTQSIIDAGFDPDTFGKSKGTNVITGEEIYGDKSQEDIDKINKEAVNDFVTEGQRKAILESPFNTAAFFTPAGMAAGVMQGAANLLPDAYDFAKDPSWSGAGAVGMDALMMSPAAKGLGKALSFKGVPKELPGSPNVSTTNNVDDLVDLWRIQEKNGKTFAQLAEEGKINPLFNNPATLAKKAEEEKYFGQWFTKDKNDFNFYKADREFTNPEIMNLKIPKSKLEQYSQYDKSLSRAPDREFVIPFEEQKLYKELPGSPNASDNVQKAGFLNPLALIDRVTPRLPSIPTTFPLGIEDDIVNWSPLNLIPGYGKRLAEPGFTNPMNSKNTGITAYRKFGNSLDDLKNSKTFSPQGGFRMGAKQIQTEGNWAEPGIANEHYKGVFAAGMNPRVPGTNIELQAWHARNGVVGRTKQGNPAIPITDPGLDFHRRLPFSNKYVPINKQKLIDNKFQLATQLPHVQSLIEKYGIAAGYGLISGYLANGKEGAVENLKTINKYSVDPIINWSKTAWGDLENKLNQKEEGGYMDLDLDEEAIIKYKEGGYIVEELDNYAEGGEPCPEGQIFNPEIGECVPKWKAPNYEVNYDDGSHYSPVSKTISLNPDQLEQAGVENIKPIMEHEKFHHWQELQDRSRMSNSGIPLRMPSPVDNQEHDGPHYHNRRELEEEQKRKEILNSIGNPDFKFIPKDVVNDRLYYGSGKNTEDPTLLDAGSNELMYQDPTTLEGEARVYENDIRGGMPSMFGEFHKHKYGGLNKFTNGGEDISIPSLTRMDDGAQVKGSQGLNADFSTNLTAFINAAKADGIDLGIGSGFRSVEKQKQLWEQALKKYGTPEKARKWVAPPGKSNHNRGTAVDLNSSGAFLGKNKNTKATQWAHANAEKFGLHFRMGHEPWHIEPLNLSKEQKAKIDAEHQHSDNEDPNTHVDPNPRFKYIKINYYF